MMLSLLLNRYHYPISDSREMMDKTSEEKKADAKETSESSDN